MPRTKAANKPGTERFRDERREEAGPRMHGRQWHDHDEPKDFEPEVLAGADATPDVEAGGEHAGMGRLRKTTGTGGREKRKRSTPPGKGPKKKPGAGTR